MFIFTKYPGFDLLDIFLLPCNDLKYFSHSSLIFTRHLFFFFFSCQPSHSCTMKCLHKDSNMQKLNAALLLATHYKFIITTLFRICYFVGGVSMACFLCIQPLLAASQTAAVNCYPLVNCLSSTLVYTLMFWGKKLLGDRNNGGETTS